MFYSVKKEDIVPKFPRGHLYLNIPFPVDKSIKPVINSLLDCKRKVQQELLVFLSTLEEPVDFSQYEKMVLTTVVESIVQVKERTGIKNTLEAVNHYLVEHFVALWEYVEDFSYHRELKEINEGVRRMMGSLADGRTREAFNKVKRTMGNGYSNRDYVFFYSRKMSREIKNRLECENMIVLEGIGMIKNPLEREFTRRLIQRSRPCFVLKFRQGNWIPYLSFVVKQKTKRKKFSSLGVSHQPHLHLHLKSTGEIGIAKETKRTVLYRINEQMKDELRYCFYLANVEEKNETIIERCMRWNIIYFTLMSILYGVIKQEGNYRSISISSDHQWRISLFFELKAILHHLTYFFEQEFNYSSDVRYIQEDEDVITYLHEIFGHLNRTIVLSNKKGAL